jgi:hypothetical protein
MQLVESIVGGAGGGEGGQDCCHIVLFFKGTIFEFQPYMRCIGATINIFTNQLQNISFKKSFNEKIKRIIKYSYSFYKIIMLACLIVV